VTTAAIELLALAALIALAGVIGWGMRGEHDQQQLLDNAKALSTCEAGNHANDSAIAALKTQLADLRAKHDQAVADAEHELVARDQQIKDLTDAATRRAGAIARSPHDDANCKALADLPLCAAVAGQLWPVSTAAGGRDALRSD
jgi:hypothetical protein